MLQSNIKGVRNLRMQRGKYENIEGVLVIYRNFASCNDNNFGEVS